MKENDLQKKLANRTGTTIRNAVKEILGRRYTRMITPDTDGGFVAEILEFNNCFGYGETETAALRNLNSAAFDWVETQLEQGLPIPEPFDEYEMSGRFALRLPRSLHSKAALYADREGVSLNTFIVNSIAGSIGMLDFIDRYASTRLDRAIQSCVMQLTLEIKGTVGNIWPDLSAWRSSRAELKSASNI